MIPTVIILVVLTLAFAATILAPRLIPQRLKLDIAPDAPLPFGTEMSWLAVRTGDAQALAAVLQLTELRAANWNSGIGAIYDDALADSYVFISPPIGGWTLVGGVAVPLPAGGSFVDKTTPLLRRLSQSFSAAQYFACFPTIDYFAWARFERGRRIRAFAVGDSGIVWNSGKPTPGERKLGLSFIELRGIKGRRGDIGGELDLYPTEQHVLSVARSWSVDPMAAQSNDAGPAVGFIARAPQTWRAERVRKVA